MIPTNSISQDFVLNTDADTSRTYQVLSSKTQGFVSDLEALKQAVYKRLATEKYEYPIYSFGYGFPFDDLIGKDPTYVKIELKRRVTECLLSDERIQSVSDFAFKTSGDELTCSFKVHSIYGELSISKEVNN